MEQLLLPFKFNNRQTVDKIVNQILERMKKESKETQEAIACEMYYRTICDKFDKMPQRLVVEQIVKLIERYF